MSASLDKGKNNSTGAAKAAPYWKHCMQWSLVREPHDGGPFTVCRWRCGSWECQACSHVKAAGWYKRAMLGVEAGQGEVKFITLTWDTHECGQWTAWARFGAGWNRLHGAIKRTWGHIEYLRVMEETKRGYPHAHLLVRGPYMEQPILSYLAGRSGLGPVVWIERPKSQKQAGRYVVKYLLKSVGTAYPKGTRRVVASRNWEAGGWTPRPRVPDVEATWLIYKMAPEQVRANFLADGKDVLYRDPLYVDPIDELLATLTE